MTEAKKTPAPDEAAAEDEAVDEAIEAPLSDEEAAPQAAGDDAAPEKDRKDPVALLAAEVSSLKDQLLRAVAETENVRRRAQREREDADGR